ncbi:solute carrier family 35 member E2 [Platysternon megacephalum]|uniref:Solute carrier family 35 member E2 n=1 Tax=Platysternon megacephalum TaxID=55544 RepID=A0A4D9EQG7_9SAUR|nr:solute carrier family 35 member E2 [Platysternon megacephalum]
MAEQRRLRRPRQGICLVLLMDMWLRVELSLATECSNDEFKVVTKEGITNCLKCSTVTRGLSDPCPDILKPTCKCSPGYQCSNLPCTTCSPLPQCKVGTELNKSGTDHFKFTCEPCKTGTYSDTLNSCCRPWTNLGLEYPDRIFPWASHAHDPEVPPLLRGISMECQGLSMRPYSCLSPGHERPITLERNLLMTKSSLSQDEVLSQSSYKENANTTYLKPGRQFPPLISGEIMK